MELGLSAALHAEGMHRCTIADFHHVDGINILVQSRWRDLFLPPITAIQLESLIHLFTAIMVSRNLSIDFKDIKYAYLPNLRTCGSQLTRLPSSGG